MAIENVLYGFNPMDIVRGYEYGVGKGIEREKGEEEIKRQRVANQIIELQNLPAARFAGMQTEAKIGAFDPARETERERLAADAALSAQARKSAEENALYGTLPGRMRSLFAEQDALNTPEQIDIRVEGKKAQQRGVGAQARVAAQQFEGMEAELKANTEAETAIAQFDREERQALQVDPTAPRLDSWEKHDRAIDRVKDPKAQQVLQQRRDQLALRELTGAAQGGDVDTMNVYLKRYGKNVEVGMVQTTDAQGQVRQAYQLFQLTPTTDAQGKTTVQRTPMAGAYYGVADNQPNWIGRYLPGLLGIAGPAPQRGQARTAAPRVATPRAQPTPKPTKAVQTPAGEAALDAASGGAAPTGRVTPKMQQDLDEFSRRQRQNMGPGARSDAGQQSIAEAMKKLTAEDQAELSRLADQTTRIAQLMQTAEGATAANGRLYMTLKGQLDALLAQPQATRQPAAVS